MSAIPLNRFSSVFLMPILALLIMQSCTRQPEKKTTDMEAIVVLDELYQDYRDFCMRNYPVWATYEGDHRFDDRLTDMRPEAFAARTDSIEDFRNRAAAADTTSLDGQALLNRSLFIREMNEVLESEIFHNEYEPFNQQGGPHIDFPQIIEVQPLNNPDDYSAYISRLNSFPLQLQQSIELARLGISRGQVPPRFVMEQVAEQCKAMAKDNMETSPFSKPLRNHPEVAGDAFDSLFGVLKMHIEERISPAYAGLADFIEREYLPACRVEPGISALPDGAARYAHAVRYHTTLPLSPDEIFAIGQQEVIAIRAKMNALIQQIGFDGNLESFVADLRTNPEFYYTSKEPMMADYRAILDRMDAALPGLFGRLPKAPYDLKEIEDYRADNAPQAYYYSAPEDRSRPGYFYVNTSKLDSRPRYTMTALALHEAVPGHHLQITIAQELENLPWFRRNISSTAFVEGWGLYAESLGYEAGLYDDPYQHFGALTFSMWRACRLVVDVGLHTKGWSREQAVAFMMANTPNSEADIRSEVDRYIAWPGQALAYKIGERKILELRAKAEKTLGSRFDLKAFHDRLLEQGPLPLPLLEERMNNWIEASRDGSI